MNFGGGNLQNFGINSNTSANGFIKSLYKKVQPHNPLPVQNSKEGGKLKDMTAGLDEVLEDEEEEDSEGEGCGEPKTGEKKKDQAEWIAL